MITAGGRRTAIILHDLFVVSLTWWLAYLTRYNFTPQAIPWSGLAHSLPLVLVAQGAVLWWTGLYKGVWRFASIPDLWNIVRAAAVGVLAVSLVLFLFNRLEGVPRATLVLYPVYLVFLLGAPRLAYRLWKDRGINLGAMADRKRVLLLGAGRAGDLLVRDMLRDGEYLPVGFLDDSPRLKGAIVHGLPVWGPISALPQIVERCDAKLVVIAMPSATNAQMQRVVQLCEQTGIAFRTLPRMHDLMSGRVSIAALRDVAIEDLLGREPVSLNWEGISEGIAAKTVLVSGAGGSIGSELCRQIARLGPRALVLVERSEFNLYTMEMELRRNFPSLTLYPCLRDVCDEVGIDRVMTAYRPEVVFHAAAYKHVPLLEHQAREAVWNNTLGTRVLARAADRIGCASFVMISTDKAVNPTNIMGASKRAAEVFCQSLDARSATRFITVRFGNVLGSTGSVVPLFQKQIAAGGPVTVTHPEITRYFMTIPEASQLILQAAVMGQGGEIFVLDMGSPVQIRYLAEQLIRLSGKVPGEDIQIVYTGLRPGEKLYEELFYSEETLARTDHDKILRARSTVMEFESLERVLSRLRQACDVADESAIRENLYALVPGDGAGAPPLTGKVIPLKQVTL